MRILVNATKEPWPPVDGGRLAMLETLRALAAAGHELCLVTPLVGRVSTEDLERALDRICSPVVAPGGPSSLRALVRWTGGLDPWSIARHRSRRGQHCVMRAVASFRPHVVLVEQLQALPQCLGVGLGGVPLVLRQHNVESLLWEFAAGFRGGVLRQLMRREARRLAIWERQAMTEVSATLALSPVDAEHLRAMVGPKAVVRHLALPFPAARKPGLQTQPGSPSVVFLASSGWRPNRDVAMRFIQEWWPVVARRIPTARLHVFGVEVKTDGVPRVSLHPAPAESREAFPADSIMALPARHPTGVPLKLLEAWSRGLAVVTTPEAAESLGARHEVELLTGADAASFADAVARLAGDPDLRMRLVEGGRARLRREHDPGRIAEEFEKLVNEL